MNFLLLILINIAASTPVGGSQLTATAFTSIENFPRLVKNGKFTHSASQKWMTKSPLSTKPSPEFDPYLNIQDELFAKRLLKDQLRSNREIKADAKIQATQHGEAQARTMMDLLVKAAETAQAGALYPLKLKADAKNRVAQNKEAHALIDTLLKAANLEDGFIPRKRPGQFISEAKESIRPLKMRKLSEIRDITI